MIVVHGVITKKRLAGRPLDIILEGTIAKLKNLPLVYDPEMPQKTKDYWKGLGFRFDVPKPKKEKNENAELAAKLAVKTKENYGRQNAFTLNNVDLIIQRLWDTFY